MNIVDLAILKKMVAGGGGSGTDNYNDLSNLPQINGETLAGNKTAENLGLQDALTFDSAPTEDSTNPVESGGVYNALAGKQDNLTFDGVYNASTNKAATESTVTNAIAGLDVSALSVDADETISSISETDGKISVTKQDIAIASNQVVAMTGYTKPSSAPATPAIQQGDTANAAIGKLEYKADVNQTNILYVADQIGKNQLDISLDTLKAVNTSGTWNGNVYTLSVGTVTVNADGSITVKKTSTASRILFYLSDKNADMAISGTKFASYILSGCPPTGSNDTYGLNGEQATSPWSSVAIEYGNGYTINTSSIPVYFYISLNAAYTTPSEGLTFKPMICTAEAWSISHEFEPYALPNYDLTRLEAEDRASLAEVVDSGAKNIAEIYNVTQNAITIATSGYKATFSGSASQDGSITWGKFHVNTTGDYVVYSNMSTSAGRFTVYNQTDSEILRSFYPVDNQTPIVLRLVAGKNYTVYSWFAAGTASACVIDLMICTKAAFGVSSAFVPYRPNYDLVCKRASGYFMTSETATFAGLLGAAVAAAGFGTTVTSHSGLCSVSTTTDDEYLLFYS